MRLFTEIRKEPALDYYGQPHLKVVSGKKETDYAELWEKFKQQQQSANEYAIKHKIYESGHSQPVGNKMPEYFECEILKPKI